MRKIKITEEQFKNLIEVDLFRNVANASKTAVVNSSELGDNWSAKYHVNKAHGRAPYIKVNGLLEPVDTSKTIPYKGVFYLTTQEVEELNKIGAEINALQARQAELLSNWTSQVRDSDEKFFNK